MMAPYVGLFNIWDAQTIISANYLVSLGLMVFCHMHSNFINRFLRLLSEYDWTFSALVVDINEDLSTKDEKEISVSSVLSELLLNSIQ